MRDDRPIAPDAISSINPDMSGIDRFFNSGNIIQSLFTELTVDVVTFVRDPVFITLLSIPITTEGGDLEAYFSACFSSPSSGFILLGGEFRLVIDGTFHRATNSVSLFGGTNDVLLTFKLSGVAAGPHTVLIEWGQQPPPGALFGLQIRPVTVPNNEHASLLVHEVQP